MPRSSEITATRQGDDGWWYNFPTMIGGKKFDEDEAWRIAKKRGMFRGVYKTVEQAVEGAKARSAFKGDILRLGGKLHTDYISFIESLRARLGPTESAADVDLAARLREIYAARKLLFDQEIAIPGQHALNDPLVAMGLDPRRMTYEPSVGANTKLAGATIMANRPGDLGVLERLLSPETKAMLSRGETPIIYADQEGAADASPDVFAHEARHAGLDLLREAYPDDSLPESIEEYVVRALGVAKEHWSPTTGFAFTPAELEAFQAVGKSSQAVAARLLRRLGVE